MNNEQYPHRREQIAAPVDTDAVEAIISRIGKQLAATPNTGQRPARALNKRALGYATSDQALRAALFRFVDVAPACRSLDDLARHLSGFLREVPALPASARAATRLTRGRVGRAAVGATAAAGIKQMSHRFIVGEDVDTALPTLRRLWERGVASSVDLLGEAALTHAEADAYTNRCEAALRLFASAAATWRPQPLLETDGQGALPRANLSVKVTAMTPLLHPEAPALGIADAAPRLLWLLRCARDVGAHLHVDMESMDTRETISGLVLDLLGRDEFADGPSAGLVVQAYLRDSPAYLEQVLAWAVEHPRKHPLVVRLVKGAYWDHEVVAAKQSGWDPPVFESKADCDRNFEELTRRLLGARPLVRVAVASHNLRSLAHALAWNEALGGSPGDVELQVLRGLGDDLADAAAANGVRVRAYCPVGDLVGGMAYLIRRLLENTSNESFLARSAQGEDLTTLLEAPC